MKLHATKSYQEIVFQLIKGKSNFSKSLLLNKQDNPVIGYGFDLSDARVLHCVLKSLNFDVTQDLLDGSASQAENNYIQTIRRIISMVGKTGIDIAKANIEAAMLERYYDKAYKNYPNFIRNKNFAFDDAQQAKVAISLLVKLYEQVLDYWLIAGNEEIVVQNPVLFTQKKTERVALLSMVMRGALRIDKHGERSMPELHRAIIDKRRSEAWFQIRYQSIDINFPEYEDVKRAYYESELFGLYDNTIHQRQFRQDCKVIYEMYNNNRQTIMAYEKQFAPLIKEANEEYKLKGECKIKTIEQSFQLAYDAIRNSQSLKANWNFLQKEHYTFNVA